VTAPRPAPRWLLPVGAAIGFLGALCGIGGGLFAVPILHYGCKLELRRAVGTGLSLVLATALAATIAELASQASALRLDLVGPLVLGTLGGTQLGYHVSKSLSPRRLKQLFALVTLIAGLRILFSSGVQELADPSAIPNWAIAFAAGLGGGVVAPILGVGGGLVFVPTLFLGIPGLSFSAARAASLATSVVTSARSSRMYWREGEVERGSALLLAAGAFVGAGTGALVSHHPSWSEFGRQGLALVLLFVCVRFARDGFGRSSKADTTSQAS